MPGACVVGVPSKDTVKVADSEGYVSETPSRGTGVECADATSFFL